jgi:hypothetical protein
MEANKHQPQEDHLGKRKKEQLELFPQSPGSDPLDKLIQSLLQNGDRLRYLDELTKAILAKDKRKLRTLEQQPLPPQTLTAEWADFSNQVRKSPKDANRRHDERKRAA